MIQPWQPSSPSSWPSSDPLQTFHQAPSSSSLTPFHFYFSLGIVFFVCFWIVLLLLLYAPQVAIVFYIYVVVLVVVHCYIQLYYNHSPEFLEAGDNNINCLKVKSKSFSPVQSIIYNLQSTIYNCTIPHHSSHLSRSWWREWEVGPTGSVGDHWSVDQLMNDHVTTSDELKYRRFCEGESDLEMTTFADISGISYAWTFYLE